MKAALAGAPVSFGVFELTPSGAAIIEPDALCEALHLAGYAGVDLGPIGYLGDAGALRQRLGRFDLVLAGGWVQLPFSDDDAFARALPELRAVLDHFAAASAVAAGSRAPLPTLADAGTRRRASHPGAGAEVEPLTAQAASTIFANVEIAAEMVRAAGFEPTFHHHAGTFIEGAAEIDALLGSTSVDLTLDTGHLVLAGCDPVEALDRWGSRINHVHIKDVDTARLQAILAAGGGMREVWSGGSFVALGHGDVDIEAVMRRLDALAYEGWIVVEQDVLNGPDLELDAFIEQRIAEQIANRHALREWV